MPDLPYPLMSDALEELKPQILDMFRDIYENRVGGATVGDVFQIGGEVLELKLKSGSGLTKTGGELDIDLTILGSAGGITKAQYTAKGVILVGTGASSFAAKTVGADGSVMKASSADSTGTVWANVTATEVTNTPAGNIEATTVQAAINELDTEKTTLTAVKADADVASAISLKHTAGSDTALGAVGTKNPPIDADLVLYRDSTASNALVTSTWTQIKAFLKTYFDTIYTGGSASSQQLSHGRLTLESGVPVSTTDQTAKTILYYTPHVGNIISLYSGTAWEDKTFSEIHIDLTETQSCTTVNGDATLTVADTSQLIVGMEISGTGIAGGTTIASITDATHLEMSANATADATNNIAFKIPASKVVDVFAYNASGSAKLAFGPLWTDGTTRATAITTKDGVPVLTGTYAISGTDYTEGKLKLLGTIRTTATAGQTQFTASSALVGNVYNKVLKNLASYNTNATWSYGTVAWREYNNGSGQVRAEFVVPVSEQSVNIVMSAFVQNASTVTFWVGIGYDATNNYTGSASLYYYSFYYLNGPAMATVTPTAGYHYVTQLENAYNAGYSATVNGQTYSRAVVGIMI